VRAGVTLIISKATLVFCTCAFLALSVACHSDKQTPRQRADSAKALFERTSKTFHIPSAEAKGDEKARLQGQAVAGYVELLRKYPDQDYWAAEALRSLGNIRAAQTNLNAAVNYYATVERKYPRQDWEILMAWKSAADVLWEAGRRDEAKVFYQKIVKRFDGAGATQVTKTVVRGSKSRLSDADLPPAR
jgi:TolA-binding protein